MIRITSLSLLAATLLFGGNARADGIAVHVAGRPMADVRAEIISAARKVCAKADALTRDGDDADCVQDTIRYSLRQIAPAYAVAAN